MHIYDIRSEDVYLEFNLAKQALLACFVTNTCITKISLLLCFKYMELIHD